VKVVIHTNPFLANQRESADWVAKGFNRHGINAEISENRSKAADIHVVQGPHYCYDHWRNLSDTHRVIWLNRCFYGDSRFDLSLGWLRPDGSRDFKNKGKTEPNGELPELKPQKESRYAAIVFADYDRDMRDKLIEMRTDHIGPLYFRPHPARPMTSLVMDLTCPLDVVWEICDIAVGHSSTVLVDAAINGLHVESTDPLHVVQGLEDRVKWLTELSWAQWGHEAIIRGDFWDHLK